MCGINWLAFSRIYLQSGQGELVDEESPTLLHSRERLEHAGPDLAPFHPGSMLRDYVGHGQRLEPETASEGVYLS